MFSIRKIRKLLNRLRGVPLVLALVGCAGEVTPEPTCRPTAEALKVCQTGNYGTPRPDQGLTCDPGAYPKGEDYFQAAASDLVPSGTWCHTPPALECERVGSRHGCASSGCWADYSCNRDPSEELGISCTLDNGVYACQW